VPPLNRAVNIKWIINGALADCVEIFWRNLVLFGPLTSEKRCLVANRWSSSQITPLLIIGFCWILWAVARSAGSAETMHAVKSSSPAVKFRVGNCRQIWIYIATTPPRIVRFCSNLVQCLITPHPITTNVQLAQRSKVKVTW